MNCMETRLMIMETRLMMASSRPMNEMSREASSDVHAGLARMSRRKKRDM